MKYICIIDNVEQQIVQLKTTIALEPGYKLLPDCIEQSPFLIDGNNIRNNIENVANQLCNSILNLFKEEGDLVHLLVDVLLVNDDQNDYISIQLINSLLNNSLLKEKINRKLFITFISCVIVPEGYDAIMNVAKDKITLEGFKMRIYPKATTNTNEIKKDAPSPIRFPRFRYDYYLNNNPQLTGENAEDPVVYRLLLKGIEAISDINERKEFLKERIAQSRSYKKLFDCVAKYPFDVGEN